MYFTMHSGVITYIKSRYDQETVFNTEFHQCLQERAYYFQQTMLLRNEVAALKNKLRNAQITSQLQTLLNCRDDLVYEKDVLLDRLVSTKLSLAHAQSELDEERQQKECLVSLLTFIHEKASSALRLDFRHHHGNLNSKAQSRSQGANGKA